MMEGSWYASSFCYVHIAQKMRRRIIEFGNRKKSRRRGIQRKAYATATSDKSWIITGEEKSTRANKMEDCC